MTSRLVMLARALARAPDMPLPQALAQWHDLKAAYRFFDNAKAVPEHSLAGHIDATRSRRSQEPVRRCTLALRSMPITLNPPQAKKRLGKVTVWAALATEATSQPKGEPMEWLLLTTLPTSDVNDVIERVHWYTCRWTIEVWHRVLKTGVASSRANWKQWSTWRSR